MAKKTKTTKLGRFRAISWDDLDDWAGATIVSRGASYQRSGSVGDLALSPTDGLLAWVEGGERYATLVDIDDDGELDSHCTCPYWTTCKHAVAVMVEFMEQISSGKIELTKVKERDKRWQRLQSLLEDEYGDEDAYDWEEEDWEEDGEDGYGGKEKKPTLNKKINDYLQSHTKQQLIELIHALVLRFPQVRSLLEDQNNLSSGSVATLLVEAKAEIEALGEEPEWDRHGWAVDGDFDLDRLQDYLHTLLEQGQADTLVELGEELLEAGSRRVEYEHEGESAMEIAECMKIIFQALTQSSLSDEDKILWAIDRQLQDGYDLGTDAPQFWQQKFSPAAWSEVAENLAQRLAKSKPKSKQDDFSSSYHRDRVSDWLIYALEHAGRSDEILPLCEREAPLTNSYDRFVRRLIDNKQLDEAVIWINRGIEATRKRAPGLAARLRDQYLSLREQAGDWSQVAALVSEDFIDRPSFERYKNLEKVAKKAKVWPTVQALILRYLEKGNNPFAARKPKWPLPKTGIAALAESRWQPSFPVTDILIDIAIAEKDTVKILHWYEQQEKKATSTWTGSGSVDDRVADAVTKTHPDKALSIWLKQANQHISQTNERGYQAGISYLRKIKKLLKTTKQSAEWQTILQAVRSQHKRKTKLMAMLDQFERTTK